MRRGQPCGYPPACLRLFRQHGVSLHRDWLAGLGRLPGDHRWLGARPGIQIVTTAAPMIAGDIDTVAGDGLLGIPATAA
jgi:hypothetical protein